MVTRITSFRVLIIEDELEFAEFIISGLTEEGFLVHAVDGDQGCEMLGRRQWDLILLDWSLPSIDGLSLLRAYRQSGGEAPVIFLTARDEVADRVTGLDSGADDYLSQALRIRRAALAEVGTFDELDNLRQAFNDLLASSTTHTIGIVGSAVRHRTSCAHRLQ